MASRLFNIYDIRKVDAPLRQRESSLKFMTRSLACMPDGEGYATASVEGRIAVEYFDPSPVVQEKKYAFKCHRQTINDVGHVWPVNALAFHPMYNTFASAGSDATVSIWDHKVKKRLRQYPKFASSISSLAFNSDETKLAANAKDANTVDFAQREREEMRDLTKASEIISVPPPDGMEGNANHVITSMPLSTGMGIGSVPGQPQPPSVLSMQALSPPVWTPHVGQVFLGNLFLFQASSLLLERRHLLGNLLGCLRSGKTKAKPPAFNPFMWGATGADRDANPWE
ncbi:Mitotic checkpoint protein bub3 [Termitomyces sp. J132]|nr:Mitotic checkpoint protein bub3 [Termitomyces sp. J132]